MIKYHILIVDDEINRCKMLEYTLTKKGYSITYTTDPFKAISIFKRENIDLVISDIKMRKMDGIQLLGELKRIDPFINVILITAYGKDDELLLKALRNDAFDFLEKIEDIDLLLNVIKKAIENREIKLNYTYYKNKDLKGNEVELIGKSKSITEIKNVIKSIAPTDSTVLITGESGTGKEIVARMIHGLSKRGDNNFVSINCGALNPNLLESELFGHKKGSFTGAYTNKDGLFKVANKGTIFLDEIAEMDFAMQVKLLRVLQEREFSPIGSVNSISVDVRIIAATNKNIEEEVKNGKFRQDLFYRLNVLRIHLPPLRQRKADIKILFNYYVNYFAKKYNKHIENIDEEVYSYLKLYSWPGNVRELINIVERIIVINSTHKITVKDIPLNLPKNSVNFSESTIVPLSQLEQMEIEKALLFTKGDKKKAALLLGINLSTLYRKLQKYEK